MTDEEGDKASEPAETPVFTFFEKARLIKGFLKLSFDINPAFNYYIISIC
jgi:hypothetical protein